MKTILFFFVSYSAFATANIPLDGYTLHDSVTGDLNKDTITDVVAVLTKSKGEETLVTLRVFHGTKDGKFTLAVDAPKAVCWQCGGMKGGDVPTTLEIAKGVLILYYNGGSRFTYSTTTKWRSQNGDFQLIGVTQALYDTMGMELGKYQAIIRDANVLTLKMDETADLIVGVKGEDVITKVEKTTCAVDAKFKSMALRDFNQAEFSEPKCTPKQL